MNRVAFTICANNYLAHVKTLAFSFKAYHPDTTFIAVIVDEPSEDIDYNKLKIDEILWVSELVSDIETLASIYNIAELCTVIKPEMIMYFYETGFKSVFYLDPDIKVFSRFTEVIEKLDKYDVVLTPHICSPTGDVGHPLDRHLIRSGIYNLGFLAMNKTEETIPFLKWWSKRVRAFGFHDMARGYFYDQIWMGYAPAFLKHVHILRHLGYNMANWNLHERRLIEDKSGYFVNDISIPLRFFHFSHFKLEDLPIIARYNQNFTTDTRMDIKGLFVDYSDDLLNHGYKKIKIIPFCYGLKNKTTGNLLNANNNNVKIDKTPSKFKKFLYLQKRSLKVLFNEL